MARLVFEIFFVTGHRPKKVGSISAINWNDHREKIDSLCGLYGAHEPKGETGQCAKVF
jgi:hypothetical protein